jgi:hypothetical protein
MIRLLRLFFHRRPRAVPPRIRVVQRDELGYPLAWVGDLADDELAANRAEREAARQPRRRSWLERRPR